MEKPNFRIGYGYDVHQLREGREFWLGGIKLEYHLGAHGHSDADVLLHAICDAILGAADLRDIGFHFPNNDNSFKDIDSKVLLAKTVKLIREKSFEVGNIDATVCLEAPKIGNRVNDMRSAIAKSASINIEDISIKATTKEKLGFVGEEKGVEAHAVCLIYRVNE